MLQLVIRDFRVFSLGSVDSYSDVRVSNGKLDSEVQQL
jgi:hypothetical protein